MQIRVKRLRNYRIATVVEYCRNTGVAIEFAPLRRGVVLRAYTIINPTAKAILADVGFSFSEVHKFSYMHYSLEEANEYIRNGSLK